MKSEVVAKGRIIRRFVHWTAYLAEEPSATCFLKLQPGTSLNEQNRKELYEIAIPEILALYPILPQKYQVYERWANEAYHLIPCADTGKPELVPATLGPLLREGILANAA